MTSETSTPTDVFLSRDDVVAAYQAILGRAPESDAAIALHMGHRTAADLITALAQSEEAKSVAKRQRSSATLAHFAPILLCEEPWSYEDLDAIVSQQLQGDLAQTWLKIDGGHKWLNYFDAYEKSLGRHVGRACNILEIGVYKGASLKLWKRYFGDGSQIVAIDIDPDCMKYQDTDSGIHVRIGSQDDGAFLARLIEEFGPFDVIIDDGSHIASHQIASFNHLFMNGLKDGGTYLIEDVETSYWGHRTGQLDVDTSIIDFAHGVVDLMHKPYSDHDYGFFLEQNAKTSRLSVPALTKHVEEVRFFDSIIVFEKRLRFPPVVKHVAVSAGAAAPWKIEAWNNYAARPSSVELSGESLARDHLNRDRYLDLMGRILTNMIYQDPSNNPENFGPFQAEIRTEGKDWPVQAHTMAGLKRLTNVRNLVQRAIDEGTPGHFAETGVWRGGCCIMMRAVLAANNVGDRKVYALDSFEGLPPPNTALYPQDAGLFLNEYTEFEVGLEQVKDHFSRYGLLDDQVEFVQGYFENTLPVFEAGPFALLRLDGDLYESTILALDHLYPKLSPGGFVVIDDYGCIPQCRQAVDDFRTRHGIAAPLTWVDWTGVWWQKT